jgi:hypothetical protein
MKGLFIFSKKAEEGRVSPQQGLFDFDAMSFGPCSLDVYRTLDELLAEGLIERIPVAGETWSRYRVTDAGKRESVATGQRESSATRYLAELRQWCGQQSFGSLLSSVYAAYPEYARNSVLPHLRPNG